MNIRVIGYEVPGFKKIDMVFTNVPENAAGVRDLRNELEGAGRIRIEYMIDVVHGLYLFTEAEVEANGWNSFGGNYSGDIWCYDVKNYSYRFQHIMK